jgi:pimeloyl-ACP methyl ester carboxylesterase
LATALSTLSALSEPAAWTDGYWWSNDGLRLHYRDYAGSVDRPPILCLPGLTRNARDFETVAARLAPHWRVIAVDLRGRGESAYAKDAMTYVPLTYVQDIERLLTDLGIDRFVAFGTSLGGIVTMLLAATGRARIVAALLNDVGPAIEARGLDRIKGYVGRGGAYPTWVHAARGIAENNAEVFPDYDLTDWLAMAKRLYRLSGNGRIVPDYDKKIAEPFRLPGGEAGIDLWPTLDALADVPSLIVRGELSDLLAPATVNAMLARLKAGTSVMVPRVGHAPVLDEAEAAVAIDTLLARVV